MNDKQHRYMMLENLGTVLACVACVTGLAAFTNGDWGWGFLILMNLNSWKG